MRKMTIILCSLIFLFFINPAFAAVKVKFFVGDATCKTLGSEEWTKVTMNQTLQNGDTVKTGAKAYVSLDLDGNIMKIEENSSVVVSQDVDGDEKVDSLDMHYGNLQLKMNKLKKSNSGFKVNTVASVAAVRGTEFTVLTGYNGDTILQVTKGKVEMTGKTKSLMVEANQQTSVPFGGDPEAIETLKTVEWESWQAESQKKLKGNEHNILLECLSKMQSLEKDIKDFETIRESKLSEKEAFDKKAQEAKSAGDNDTFKENASNAFKSLRQANFSLFRIYVKASRMEMVKEMTERSYRSVDKEDLTPEINETYTKIYEIYNTYYSKYIKETIEARQKIEERRKNKK